MMLARYLGLLLVIVLAASGDLGAIIIGTPIPEIGDPENISSTGRPYKELPVDAELFTIQIGDVAVWYPPTVVVDLTGRETERRVFIKIVNKNSIAHKFYISEDPAFSSATALKLEVELNANATKYIGIPTSSLSYVTNGSTLTYTSSPKSGRFEGQIVFVLR